MSIDCPICTANNPESIYQAKDFPIHHLYPIRTSGNHDELFGALDVGRCVICGHIYNSAYSPAKSNLSILSHLTNFPVSLNMKRDTETLATFLLRYLSKQSVVADIGGGGGALACELSKHVQRVDLIDPALRDRADLRFQENIFIFPMDLMELDKNFGDYDLVLCKQTLEHIHNPVDFLLNIGNRLKRNGLAYVEVPRFEYIYENYSIVDYHYPHVNYFSNDVLNWLFRASGLEVERKFLIKNGHDVGFLLRKSFDLKKSEPCYSRILALDLERLKTNYLISLKNLHRTIQSFENSAVAFYGANAYSQSLLTLFGPAISNLTCILDDTSYYEGFCAYNKEGKVSVFLPNTKNLMSIDAIVITAYLHEDSIIEKLEKHKFKGKILSVQIMSTESRLASVFGAQKT